MITNSLSGEKDTFDFISQFINEDITTVELAALNPFPWKLAPADKENLLESIKNSNSN